MALNVWNISSCEALGAGKELNVVHHQQVNGAIAFAEAAAAVASAFGPDRV